MKRLRLNFSFLLMCRLSFSFFIMCRHIKEGKVGLSLHHLLAYSSSLTGTYFPFLLWLMCQLDEEYNAKRWVPWQLAVNSLRDRMIPSRKIRSTVGREVLLEMKVDRLRANHSLRLTASQGTPNIPFHWFQLLGSYRQAQKKEIIAWLSVRSKRNLKPNESDQASVGT